MCSLFGFFVSVRIFSVSDLCPFSGVCLFWSPYLFFCYHYLCVYFCGALVFWYVRFQIPLPVFWSLSFGKSPAYLWFHLRSLSSAWFLLSTSGFWSVTPITFLVCDVDGLSLLKKLFLVSLSNLGFLFSLRWGSPLSFFLFFTWHGLVLTPAITTRLPHRCLASWVVFLIFGVFISRLHP